MAALQHRLAELQAHDRERVAVVAAASEAAHRCGQPAQHVRAPRVHAGRCAHRDEQRRLLHAMSERLQRQAAAPSANDELESLVDSYCGNAHRAQLAADAQLAQLQHFVGRRAVRRSPPPPAPSGRRPRARAEPSAHLKFAMWVLEQPLTFFEGEAWASATGARALTPEQLVRAARPPMHTHQHRRRRRGARRRRSSTRWASMPRRCARFNSARNSGWLRSGRTRRATWRTGGST